MARAGRMPSRARRAGARSGRDLLHHPGQPHRPATIDGHRDASARHPHGHPVIDQAEGVGRRSRRGAAAARGQGVPGTALPDLDLDRAAVSDPGELDVGPVAEPRMPGDQRAERPGARRVEAVGEGNGMRVAVGHRGDGHHLAGHLQWPAQGRLADSGHRDIARVEGRAAEPDAHQADRSVADVQRGVPGGGRHGESRGRAVMFGKIEREHPDAVGAAFARAAVGVLEDRETDDAHPGRLACP